jgi:hypothetical protein
MISPTLVFTKRYEWLHGAHACRNRSEEFLQDLIKLFARYHPRAKFLNRQGSQLKLANH